MSLTAQDRCPVVLKTADQYPVWKARIGDSCWAACHKDIWTVSNTDCAVAIKEFAEAKGDGRKKQKDDWVGRCWLLITASLHDDLYTRVAHVPKGNIATLLGEIGHALVVNTAEDITPLRLQLYGGTMQKDGDNDLQKWIAFILEKVTKLEVLGKKMEEEEKVGIFLKGLNPVFQTLQVYFSVPGQTPKELAAAIDITRKYAATPIIAAELAKLKANGLSQTTFIATTAGTSSAANPANRALCKLYSRSGTCRFGAKCKFVHTAAPNSSSAATSAAAVSAPAQLVKCSFCNIRGHTIEVCRKRQAHLAANKSTTTSSLLAAEDDAKHIPLPEISGLKSKTPLLLLPPGSTTLASTPWCSQ